MPMRNVIVTGGSRGLGLSIARTLVNSGYRVVAVARKESDTLRAALHDANLAHPDLLRFVACDLAQIETIPDLVKSLRKELGPIYGLVNNAGISFEGSLALMPTAQIEQLLRVNTLAPILLTKHIVRSMMADGEGRIVNIASVVASTGYSGLSVYGASKAAIVGFTRSLAREVGRLGINVNAVAPGFVDTDMTHSLTADQRAQIERRSALKRLAEAEDVAHAVEYLLSDKARNMTGTVLTVDAGATA